MFNVMLILKVTVPRKTNHIPDHVVLHRLIALPFTPHKGLEVALDDDKIDPDDELPCEIPTSYTIRHVVWECDDNCFTAFCQREMVNDEEELRCLALALFKLGWTMVTRWADGEIVYTSSRDDVMMKPFSRN